MGNYPEYQHQNKARYVLHVILSSLSMGLASLFDQKWGFFEIASSKNIPKVMIFRFELMTRLD